MGVAHCGTCSLERYFVSQGYDVIRNETSYRARTLEHYAQLWADRQPVFIISDKTQQEDIDHINTYWESTNPIVLHLNDLKEDPAFPWENKGGTYKVRPNYHKYETGFA